MRRGLRRARAEQPLLPLECGYVRDAVATVGEHHRHIDKHPARIMRRAPLPRVRQRRDSAAVNPDPSANSTSNAPA